LFLSLLLRRRQRLCCLALLGTGRRPRPFQGCFACFPQSQLRVPICELRSICTNREI
jgi:hypothetical protein